MWPIVRMLMFGVAGILLVLAGCRRGTAKVDVQSPKNLRTFYEAYKKATEEKGKPPAKREELAPFLPEPGEIENLLKSPEDGEPYTIHWGASPGTTQAVVLAYETKGTKGRRWVLYGHIVYSMNDEELKKAKFPDGFAAPP